MANKKITEYVKSYKDKWDFDFESAKRDWGCDDIIPLFHLEDCVITIEIFNFSHIELIATNGEFDYSEMVGKKELLTLSPQDIFERIYPKFKHKVIEHQRSEMVKVLSINSILMSMGIKRATHTEKWAVRNSSYECNGHTFNMYINEEKNNVLNISYSVYKNGVGGISDKFKIDRNDEVTLKQHISKLVDWCHRC